MRKNIDRSNFIKIYNLYRTKDTTDKIKKKKKPKKKFKTITEIVLISPLRRCSQKIYKAAIFYNTFRLFLSNIKNNDLIILLKRKKCVKVFCLLSDK